MDSMELWSQTNLGSNPGPWAGHRASTFLCELSLGHLPLSQASLDPLLGRGVLLIKKDKNMELDHSDNYTL